LKSIDPGLGGGGKLDNEEEEEEEEKEEEGQAKEDVQVGAGGLEWWNRVESN